MTSVGTPLPSPFTGSIMSFSTKWVYGFNDYVHENYFENKNEDLSLIHFNIRSVSANIYKFTPYLVFVIICISETWLIYLFQRNICNRLSVIDWNYKSCFQCGDVNVGLLKIDVNINISSFYDYLGYLAFIATIFKPTRITDNSCSLIDNIFANNKN